MTPACKVVGARVDALTIAYRAHLLPPLVRHLRERAELARKHGRAAVEWVMRAPDVEGSRIVDERARFGELPARWAEETAHRERVVKKRLGELRYSRVKGAWAIVNEPFFRVMLTEKGAAAGEGAATRCGACDGLGVHEGAGPCGVCDGLGELADPGWNVEIVWYAQELARIGLRAALAESHALAASWGDVLESRVRRIDLCADVSGWEVKAADVHRIAKRPRASWTVEDDGIEAPDPWDLEPTMKEGSGAAVAGGGQLGRRRVTGITIGRGGDISCRIYDKRVELGRSSADSATEKREAEERRWSAGGWDGCSPVARVEFQIRGMALAEFGLRNPDAAVEPVSVLQDGKRVRAGVRVAVSEDGEILGLADQLDRVWASCLQWVRLVVPEATRTGKPKPVSRLALDARWILLAAVSFDGQPQSERRAPLARFRKRAAASSAQALGVTLSQAAREGVLVPWAEDFGSYEGKTALPLLRARVRALKLAEVERIVAWLLEREGSSKAALVHLAVRANATRARFLAYARAEGARAGPKSSRHVA